MNSNTFSRFAFAGCFDRVRLSRGSGRGAAVILACSCLSCSAAGRIESWPALTDACFESKFAHGTEGWVGLPAKAASPGCTGTFDLESESDFVLREHEGGADWKYKGTYVHRKQGKALVLSFDEAGRAALARKIKRMAKPVPLDGRVTILSAYVHFGDLSDPVLVLPAEGGKQKMSFSGTGSYRVLWRYFWVWPLPVYYGSTTWKFTFHETVVVGPGGALLTDDAGR